MSKHRRRARRRRTRKIRRRKRRRRKRRMRRKKKRSRKKIFVKLGSFSIKLNKIENVVWWQFRGTTR